MTHRRQNFMGGAAILAGAVAVTKLLGRPVQDPAGEPAGPGGHGAFLRRVQHLQSAAGAVHGGTAGGPEPHGVPCRRPAALWRRAPLPAPGPGPAGGAGAGVLRRYVPAAGGPGRRAPRSGRGPGPADAGAGGAAGMPVGGAAGLFPGAGRYGAYRRRTGGGVRRQAAHRAGAVPVPAAAGCGDGPVRRRGHRRCHRPGRAWACWSPPCCCPGGPHCRKCATYPRQAAAYCGSCCGPAYPSPWARRA